MLSQELNEQFTRVGPGTPAGDLMRRYWHPIAITRDLADKPTKAVRILGEDLVLYKDRSGTLGLIQEKCPHRRVNLAWGIPEQHGLRCPYHGWLFDETGQCLETPAEGLDSSFKNKIQVVTYPVQELGGLIFTYMGPEPAPLLPRWDLFVQDGVRDIYLTDLECNWMQCMENSMDPHHTEWLHAYWTFYQMELEGKDVPRNDKGNYAVFRHLKVGFDRFEYGIVKRRLMEGQSEDHDDWVTGHPVIFPNILRTNTGFQIRVPVDDTHTWHLAYRCRPPQEGETPDAIHYHDMPVADQTGKFHIHQTLYQDMWAWWTQGPIAQRDKEKLGESDAGVIMFRKLLQEQLALVADGADPMCVFRDPEQNQRLDIHTEQNQYMAFLNDTDVEAAKKAAALRRPGYADKVDRAISGFVNTR